MKGVQHPQIGGYGPTSAMSEADLLRGYRRMTEREVADPGDCACGGRITAEPGGLEITRAVRRHQDTASHRAWREGQ